MIERLARADAATMAAYTPASPPKFEWPYHRDGWGNPI